MNESKLVALHQYAAPAAMAILAFGAVGGVLLAGSAVMRGSLGGSEFVAILAQFFGLVGVALGVGQKREGRTGDGAATVTTTTTGAAATQTEVKP